MVSRGKSRDRIEPSFDDEREDEDFRLDADDRIIGGKKTRAKGKKQADKRETSAKRDWERQKARIIKNGFRS